MPVTPHQSVDGAHLGQRGSDLLRPGQVQGETPGRADLLGDGRGPVGGTSGEDHLVSTAGVEPRDVLAEAGRSADDDHTAHCYLFSSVDGNISLRMCRSLMLGN
ncbi:hypothetical protein GCM10010129_68300 [Streptomyces fumigatiscleroticus]|nr:hypothetical protein GCM10010129_68300 [Streptomyces fumigatiscleroticus]